VPYNGSNTFTPDPAGYPVVAGTLIEAADFNAVMADIAQGLSEVVTRDGQGALTGDMDAGGFKLRNLFNGTSAQDAVTLSQAQTEFAPKASPTMTGTATMAAAVATSFSCPTFTSGANWTLTVNGVLVLTIDAISSNVEFTSPVVRVEDADQPGFEIHRTGERAVITYMDSSNQLSENESDGSGVAGGRLRTVTSLGGTWFGLTVPYDLSSGSLGAAAEAAGYATFHWYQAGVKEWWMGQLPSDTRLLIGWNARNSGNHALVIDDSPQVIHPGSDNSWGLGDGSFRWTAVYATNGTIQTSDVRFKTAIRDLDQGLSFILSLRPVAYRWTVGDGIDHFGLIAQEVEEHLPQNAGMVTGKDIKGMNYSEFVAPLILSIQQLTARVIELETAIRAK